jgi:tRNA A-37 threonylcarbamoyl transferase component Bud32
MAPEEPFERAIQALLDGVPVVDRLGTSGAPVPIPEPLCIVDAIARAHRTAIFGSERAADRPAATRWGTLDIRGEIGRGANGTVYRAWDTNLERELALKLLTADGARSTDARQEGQLLARLNHPHIVRVFGADTHDGVAGIWMELLDGETLDEILARDGVFGADDALLIGLDLAGALAAVHAAGLLHRDIKARNVMRERGGRIMLMDLGAGRPATRPDEHPEAGTPLYMATEVLAGAPATEQSDIYSLGVLLYRLLAGTYPVVAEDVKALRSAHEESRRSTLLSHRPDLDPDVADLIERACHPQPDARYRSAAELESTLATALQSRLTRRATVPSTLRRRWTHWRRRVLTSGAAITLVFLTAWASWDTTAGRALRRRVGLVVPPRSDLYLVVDGAVAIVRGHTIRLVAHNPTAATAIAVSTDLGIRTMAGARPWTAGAAYRLDGTELTAPPHSGPQICCFGDGTTDGEFNYSVRQDSWMLEPWGSRPLDRPALYRFARDWSNPELLFTLRDDEGFYFGVAYSMTSGTFWLTRNSRDGGSIEHWSRRGALLSLPVKVEQSGLSGIAIDPADDTMWVARPESNGLMRLENLDSGGRQLGSLDLLWPLPIWQSGGAEFAWRRK